MNGESYRSSRAKQYHLVTVCLTHFLYKRINANPLEPSILPSLRNRRPYRVLQPHLLQRSLHQPHFAKVPHIPSYCFITQDVSLQDRRFGRIKRKGIRVAVKRCRPTDSTRLKLRGYLGLDASYRDPIVLVVGVAEAGKRSNAPLVGNKLIENPDSRETRYGTSDIICVVVLDSHPI